MFLLLLFFIGGKLKQERKRKKASKSPYDLELCVPGVFDSNTHALPRHFET